MNDTPSDIQQLYSDFIMSKSVTERFRMGFDMIDEGRRMIDEGRRMIDCSVAHQHPDWSEAGRKAAVFERIYRTDFSADEMERIKASIMKFHQRPTTR